MKQTIAVYGYGYVGKALCQFLKDHYRLQIVEPNIDHADHEPITEAGITDFEHASNGDDLEAPAAMAIICVPTPMRDDGTCDTSIVEGILKAARHEHYLVKSTVPPGTCARLARETGRSVCHSPEFIGEGKYEIPWWTGLPHPTDMKKHSFHIFGGPQDATTAWVRIWQKVAGWAATYQQTDSTTSELVKYMENMMLATRKLFFSEMFLVAQAFGVNYDEAKELLLLDTRIGRAMSLVWPEKLAYDGKCLPKDTAAIVAASTAAGHDPKLFRAVVERNKELASKPQ